MDYRKNPKGEIKTTYTYNYVSVYCSDYNQNMFQRFMLSLYERPKAECINNLKLKLKTS